MMHRAQLAVRLAFVAAAIAWMGPLAAAQDISSQPNAQQRAAPQAAQGPTEAPSAPSASAPQRGAEPTTDGRYVFYRMQDSIMRLDTRTGQVSQCSGGTPGWSCQAVPNERAALESEIGRLQGENAALKKELLARSIPLPDGVRGEAPAAKAPNAKPGASSPTDADFDRVLTFMEKLWRRLVEMMAELQRDTQRKG